MITIPHNFDPSLRPYQLEILKNPARFKSLVIHRRAGKTALSLNQLIRQAYLFPKKVFWYLAPTYRQAKDIVWRDPDMLQKYCPEEIVRKKNDTELTIYFKNGSVLSVKGADEPDSLRGANPQGVVLDEFALMKREVWDEIISPIIYANPNAWVWFIGTPKPQGQHFRQLHDKAQHLEDWYAHTLNADTSKIIPKNSLEAARATMTQAGFEQEYLCKWFEDGGVVFKGIDDIIYGEYKIPKTLYPLKWGLDLAKLVDWTVLTGLSSRTHELEVFERFNQIDYTLQKARIESTWRRHGGGIITADQTGVGEPIIEDMAYSGMSMEGIKFSAAMKKELIDNLAIGIENRDLTIPNIPELIRELQVFGYEITKAGNMVYGAPPGEHDDCVISLALAYWGIGDKIQTGSGNRLTDLLNQKPKSTAAVEFSHE